MYWVNRGGELTLSSPFYFLITIVFRFKGESSVKAQLLVSMHTWVWARTLRLTHVQTQKDESHSTVVGVERWTTASFQMW